MITMGIDQSMSSTGVAVVKMHPDETFELLHAEEIRTSSKVKGKKVPHGKRLNIIGERLLDIYDMYDVDYVVREQGIMRHINATKVLFKVVGMVEYVIYQKKPVEMPEIGITTAKKFITGSGRAEKSEMEIGVRNILNIDDPDYFKTSRGRLQDDIVDAVALALTHFSKNILKQERVEAN